MSRKQLLTSTISAQELLPVRADLLSHLGYSQGVEPATGVNSHLQEAEQLFLESARPELIIDSISKNKFQYIFKGQGNNSPESPLQEIYPQADALALFCLTLGYSISDKIAQYFQSKDSVSGYILDACTSLAAEKWVSIIEKQYFEKCYGFGKTEKAVLSYSPGYCGWHISSQEKIFEYLKPDSIDVTLTDEFLMIPMKSVTGILVAGDRTIHKFIPRFSFCRACVGKSCIERIKSVTGGSD